MNQSTIIIIVISCIIVLLISSSIGGGVFYYQQSQTTTPVTKTTSRTTSSNGPAPIASSASGTPVSAPVTSAPVSGTSAPVSSTSPPTPVTWTKIPKNKVSSDNLHVCRATYEGASHPGKTWDGFNNCNIGWGGNEITISDFEYLENNKSYNWLKTPKNKVKDGDLYVCRASYQGASHPGKTWDGFNNCNIGWGGKEMTISDFEYLSYD